MNKKIIVALVFSFFIFSMLSSLSSPRAGSEGNGEIIFVAGDVRINGKVAEVGMMVETGSTLKTAKNSFCEIVFDEKNIFKIFENSETILDFTAKSKGIFLKTGAIASVVKRLIRFIDLERYRYAVRTPTAVAGVRGTSFYVRVEKDDNTYICCCNGVICLEDSTGEDLKHIEASHHKAVRLKRVEDQVFMTPEEMLYHTDQGMERLAEKINVRIDWNKIDREIESF
jgi:hypothetical protein